MRKKYKKMAGRLVGKVALVTAVLPASGRKRRTSMRAKAPRSLADVNDNAGHAVSEEIGDAALYAHLDTRSEAEWQAVVEQVVETYGRLDILVNAAGVSGRRPDGASAPNIEEQDLEDWNPVMDVNSTGIFLGMKTAIPEMRKTGGGSIINISSIHGLVGSAHNAAYHASKGSVRLATKSAALQYDREHPRELRPSGFCNDADDAIHARRPRTFRAPPAKTPMNRYGLPIDIANGCLFLASDESGWMTGAELVIDGGMTAG